MDLKPTIESSHFFFVGFALHKFSKSNVVVIKMALHFVRDILNTKLFLWKSSHFGNKNIRNFHMHENFKCLYRRGNILYRNFKILTVSAGKNSICQQKHPIILLEKCLKPFSRFMILYVPCISYNSSVSIN